MTYTTRIILIFLVVFATPLYANDRWELYFTANSLSLSESTSIKDLIEDFEQFNNEGDTAFTHNQAEFGARINYANNTFGIAAVKRFDYIINYTTETAELFYLDGNNLPVDPGKTYPLKLVANHMQSDGIKFSWDRKISNALNTSISVSWLNTSDLNDGNISGVVSIDESGEISGVADVDYSYEEDQLFDRVNDGTTGEGYSVDVGVEWQAVERLNIKLHLADVLNEFTWDRSAYTEASINTLNSNLDANGVLNVVPILSGIESYRKHRQTLPTRATFRADYTLLNNWRLIAHAFNIDSTTLTELGGAYQFNDNHRLELGLNTQTSALRVHYQNRILSVGLISDALNLDEAEYLGLNISLNIGF